MTRAHSAPPPPPHPDTLRELREAEGLSQTTLARMIHLSGPSRVSDWEHGKHPIDPRKGPFALGARQGA
jgi:transcriptional regulator with XRE-family HTH domain